MSLFDFKKSNDEVPNLLVGIDLGYGQVKVLSDNKQYKFLSAVGTPISDFGRVANIANEEDLLKSLVITYEGTKYYVGHNAILNTRGALLNGCTIYVSLFPCNECAKAIIQTGIKKVIYMSDKYSDSESTLASKRMLDMCGVEYTKFVGRVPHVVFDEK